MNYTPIRLIFIFFTLFSISCKVQKTVPIARTECDSLFFDLDSGSINSVSPLLSQMEIREWFTCYTRVVPEGAYKDCGGGIFYEKHGFFYNTYQDYVEADSSFKGNLSISIMGKSKMEVENLIGLPLEFSGKEVPSHVSLYPRIYGCLGIKYNKNGKVSSVNAYTVECDRVLICDR